MRDDVLTSLVERALTDEEFRQAARLDLEPTLAQHGYELTDEELDAVRLMQAQTSDLSDEQLTEQLQAMSGAAWRATSSRTVSDLGRPVRAEDARARRARLPQPG